MSKLGCFGGLIKVENSVTTGIIVNERSDMKIKMTNELGFEKEVKMGFSWTVFFFGPIALAIREQYIEAILCLIIGTLTMGIYQIYLAFTANEKLYRKLRENGYKQVN